MNMFDHMMHSAEFMPHGGCYLWTTSLIALHAISDAFIVLAYFSIPFTLVYFVRKRKDLKFNWMFVCFAVFILACGTTHLLEIWNIWHANYWVSGFVKAVTAAASVPTAILLVKLIPQALALPSPDALRKAYDELEIKVQERTHEIAQTTKSLEAEIAERRHVEQALRESEELFSKAFLLSPDYVSIARLADRTVIRANDALCQLWGCTPEEVIGRPTREYINWLHDDERQAFIQRLSDQGECLNYETTLRMADGRLLDFNISSRMISFNGESCVLSVLRDITERKRAEAAAARLAAIITSSDDAIIGKDLDGIITSWNRGAEKIFGYSAAEMVGASISRLIPGDRQTEEALILNKIKQGESIEHFETLRRTKDGRLIEVSLTASPIKDATGRVIGVSKVSRDITDRKAAQEKNAWLASFPKQNPNPIIELDPDAGVLNYVNPTALRIFPGLPELGVTHPYLAGLPEIVSALRANQDEVIRRELGVGEYLFSQTISCVVKTGRVRIYGADITQRKNAEEILRESEERYRTLFNTLIEGFCTIEMVYDAAGKPVDYRFLEVNPAFEKHTGLHNARGRLMRDLAPDHEAYWFETYGRVAMTGEAIHFENEAKALGRFYDVYAYRVGGAESRKVAILFSDITERRQAAEALMESEARFRALFEQSPVGIAQGDVADISFISVNQRYCDILGYSREELVQLNFKQFTHPDDLPADLANMEQMIAGEIRHYTMAKRFIRKDGVVVWASLTVVPLWAPGETPDFYMAVVEDITERRHAEEALRESRALYRSLVEQMPAGVFRKDAAGRYVFVSSYFCRLRNTTPDKFLGKLPRELPATEERFYDQATNHHEEIMQTGRSIEVLDEYHRADGAKLYFHVVKSPVFDGGGKIIGSQGVLLDVTANKQAEDEIRRLNAELEQRVIERTAQLEAANKELEAFSYSVSHDLRAPLRAVNGFAGIVLEDFGPQLPEAARHHLERIRNGGQRMGELIDDLLAFSRLSRQPLNRQKVDLTKLVQNALDELKSQREGRELEVRVEDLPPCYADPALLKQVWVNLLSNAIKYSRDRHPAVVEVGCVCQNNEAVYFVRDNGTGFDMQYAHKLFGVFQRLHRADEFEGTGVGLAIVQRIIHRHGGRVWAEAAVESGATFYFTLAEKNQEEKNQP